MDNDAIAQIAGRAPARVPREEAIHVLHDLAGVRRYLDAYGVGTFPLVAAAAVQAPHPGSTELAKLIRLAQRFGLPLFDGETLETDPAVAGLLPAPTARQLDVVPIAANDAFVAVATSELLPPDALAMLEFLSTRRVVLVLARAAVMRQASSSRFDRAEDEALIRRLGLEGSAGEDAPAGREAERLSNEQPVVRLVAELIEQAVRRRASDIHVRPGGDDFEVLYRIDGTLVSARRFLKPLLAAVVSRFKVLAGMNLAEHRTAQDGRATLVVAQRAVDLRFSVLPTIHGESVVIRLLDASRGLRSLHEIGFGPEDQQQFGDLLLRDHGLLLVTGPTGCGKSTTLYAALLECRRQNVNIVTVEDPVEYHVSDVQQIQLNRAAGMTFASALRNILRHDPDVVMVGEIRDRETAQIAIESALTGHLVLSTLHTNDAASAVTRLLDLGAAPFLLRPTLLAVLAQRLARRNCPHCRAPEPVDAHVREVMAIGPDERFSVGAGCAECAGTGVLGRVAMYELLVVDEAIRALIVDGADAGAIHDAAIAGGMRSLTMHALDLARSGAISLREAFLSRVD